MQRIFSSRDVGRLVGADPSSVNRWIDSGRLKAYRTPGGHRRVFYEDLVSFLGELKIPLPAALRVEALKLLVVDADERHLKGLRRALSRTARPLLVLTCNSPLQALLQIGAQRPDAVLLDVLMPGVDGAEFCRCIRSHPGTRHTQLIACAAHGGQQLESRLREAGAAGFLAKPVKPAALLELLPAASTSHAA